jgi:hypothetical protein
MRRSGAGVSRSARNRRADDKACNIFCELEDKSRNTRENALFSKDIINANHCDQPVRS